MFNVLPIFKSHYSLQKSLLTLEEPKDKKGEPVQNSIFYILNQNKINTLVLVEDNVSGLLPASQIAEKNKTNLIFGLRLWITDNIEEKTEDSLKKQAKYIIFIKNKNGYKDLLKIWSTAAKVGFYYEPRLDWGTLKGLWNPKNLRIVVPHYDSFLHLNSLESYLHVPDFELLKDATFLTENNSLPFDDYLEEKIKSFAASLKAPVLPAQSIYYKSPDDFVAYMTFRCISNRTNLDKPELNHMGSDEFNFEKWKRINENIL